ncbi:hypothetical protein [Intrasporangium sp.]|uniref:hypothetical protein n=1 Tax=Intrasporangium sp. TaxID=1925024 RepID=UPI00293A2F83|nr:hypothetical protein [Intrasporangium sp.]MDV3221300.1 hypothetical protein [Intrasporangium sp.]
MRRRRRYAEYAPLRPGRARRSWLRTAQLNVVGWSALVGVCAAAGAAGVLVARALGASGWWGLVVSLVPVGAVVLADRRRWAAMETSYGWSGSVGEVARIAQELRGRGVDAEVRPDAQYEQPWWDRIDAPAEAPHTASLVYPNRHEATVRAVLRQHGIAPPERW